MEQADPPRWVFTESRKGRHQFGGPPCFDTNVNTQHVFDISHACALPQPVCHLREHLQVHLDVDFTRPVQQVWKPSYSLR